MKLYERKSPEQWEALVSDQQASQLSAPEYCKQNHIAYASFSKWRTKLKNAANTEESKIAVPFVELTAPEKTVEPTTRWHIELDLAPGVQLRIAR